MGGDGGHDEVAGRVTGRCSGRCPSDTRFCPLTTVGVRHLPFRRSGFVGPAPRGHTGASFLLARLYRLATLGLPSVTASKETACLQWTPIWKFAGNGYRQTSFAPVGQAKLSDAAGNLELRLSQIIVGMVPLGNSGHAFNGPPGGRFAPPGSPPRANRRSDLKSRCDLGTAVV